LQSTTNGIFNTNVYTRLELNRT